MASCRLGGRSGAVEQSRVCTGLRLAVLFLTLPVLVWSIDAAGDGASGVKRAFSAGWWFGFGFFFAGLFWIGEAFLVEADKFGWALPFAVTLMPAGLALFYAAASALARFFWRDGFGRILVLALALFGQSTCGERCSRGFPGIRSDMR